MYDYSEFQIVETGANFVFPIHDDTPCKLPVMLFISNQNIIRDNFYENKKNVNNKKIIDWKSIEQFFSRSERKTWHSYREMENQIGLFSCTI